MLIYIMQHFQEEYKEMLTSVNLQKKTGFKLELRA